jgi:uncharacterized protein (UPF0218 family)
MELRLDDSLRKELSKPLGKILSESEFRNVLAEYRYVVTVGDRVTETSSRFGRDADIQIVDNRERRRDRSEPMGNFLRRIKLRNPAGTLSEESLRAVKEAVNSEKPVRIVVEGEEDLLALPAILLSPKGSAVFYGQPDTGIVMVEVDNSEKERCIKILKQIGFEEKIIDEYSRDC